MEANLPRASELLAAGRLGWRRSLRTRLMFWSSLTSVVLLLGVAAVFYAALRGVLIENAKTEIRGLASQTTRGLAATLESVQVSGQALAGNATAVGLEPMRQRALLMSTLRSDPSIAGAMVIIEPGRLSPEDPGFDWYIRREGRGFTESSVQDLGYDYRVMPWYTRTTGVGRAWWGEPYANAATGMQYFVTFNLPLRRAGDGPEGAVIGMVSVDVPLQRLRAQLGALPDSSNLIPVLYSPEHRLVLHPDPAIAMQYDIGKLATTGGRSDLAPMADHIRRRQDFEVKHRVASGPAEGRMRYTFGGPVGDTGWSFSLSVDEGVILAQLNRITLWGVLGGLLGVLLCVAAVRRYSGMIARPIEDITNTARHFAKGEFDYPLGHTDREDEVGVLARAFDTARGSIKRQMTEIADMGAARARLEGELNIAANIQQAMLPAGSEFDAGEAHLEFHGMLEPAKAVGGDFYNLFERDGDSLWFVIGDVSDKGVPAALFMARTMTVLEVAAQLGGSPGKALREAAKHLVEGNETCMFATVLCGVIELRTGALALASAGHEAPVILRADGRREFVPVPTEGPLGVDVAREYPAWRGRLMPGDTLFTYTDGITEAFDRDDQPFGTERLLATLDPALSARAQCAHLVDAVHAFANGAPQSDDITVLAIRYRRDARGRARFTVKASLQPPLPGDAVRQLLAQVDAGLESHGLPATLMHDVHLVVEEVACNVIDHGADDGREPTLELLATVEGNQLAMEFRDDGRPFDPLSQPTPDLYADIADRPIGGLGVHLIRELAEEVAYARDDGHNILRIVLHIPAPERTA
ncbi:SpoIIE family protein phosphatase [Arenimonas sp.]|uniref:SpoIIE family protein phosphatase n=1 Tax=Arenimonas sp. TaxID=1872635 RepID=UPI0025C16647|nr:SpoIIE family protein phosphatase [Arenimonas sp.]